MGSFNPSLHLFAWSLGSCLVRWLEAQYALLLARHTNKHVSFWLKRLVEVADPAS